MPLYEYQCDACGHRFEQIRKFSDPPLTVCPKCDGVIRKLVSSPAIQFKGTGWYVTDYANKGRSGGTEASEAGKASGDTTPQSGDKKPADSNKADTTTSTPASSSSATSTSTAPTKPASTSGD